MDILFCDFTGVYEREGLKGYGDLIDFKELSGTGMYIDAEAEKALRERLSAFIHRKEYRLRFLDNGNYHYMTRILASYVKEPFDLITFDNHTDDKPPAFPGLKSCGSWRLDIAAENKYLKSSLLVRRREDMEALAALSGLPLYISLDKDILSRDVLRTNWDQGDMNEAELFTALEELYRCRRVIAFDVCGEDLPDAPCTANANFNKRLIKLVCPLLFSAEPRTCCGATAQ